METLTPPNSVAGQLAAQRFQAAIDAAVAGETFYPEDATFIGSDAPHLGPTLARCAREYRPVVVVYPDGQERVLRFDQAPVPETMRSLAAALASVLSRSRRRARRTRLPA